MAKRMTDDDLLSQIEQLERQAVGYYTGEIASDQAKAMDFYLSKPFGTEEEGRSQVISSDVWDVVEGMTPMVLRPFVSSDDVVRFNPIGKDDEERAKQESDYINWVVTQKNDVFNELMAWVKTGLLQKNGVVKYWWDKTRKASIERYFGLADDDYAMLIQDDEVKVIEHSEIPGEMGPGQPMQDPQTGQVVQGPPVMGQPTHDVTIRVSEEVGEAKYRVIAPEEFLISKDAASPNPKLARFCQHRRMMTLSAIRDMGYDVDDDIAAGDEDTLFSEQYQARRQDEGNFGGATDEGLDPASREVMFKESYVQIDFDGDGLTELRKICAVGRKMLVNEETEEAPFCGWTPYTQPFKFYGRCPADEAIEIQEIKSTILRQTMDNIYTINNNRVYVSDKVNLDDLVDNQIAGIVRVPGTAGIQNDVKVAEIQPIGAITMPMIEYFDGAKENRTGFTRYNQGTDADSLNKTATGVRIIKAAGDMRNELVSRAFAEQGLSQLMIGIHGLCRRHATKAETIQLRGEWVDIDPRQWRKRSDMTVSVGLGNADQQMKLQAVQLLAAAQGQLMAAGIVTPQNLYNGAAKMVEAVGFKNPDQFFTPPDKMPQQPQQEDPAHAFEAAKIEIADKAHNLDEKRFLLETRKVDILDRDSLVKADVAEAETALQAELQGHNVTMQIMEALQGLKQQSHDMSLSIAQMQAQRADSEHVQSLAVAGHGLQAQGQEHGQMMAEQAQQQAAEQAAQQAQEPTDGQA